MLGIYAGFTIGGVTQRLRWIPPARFLMGSPSKEAGRWDDEGPVHEVQIAEGFWLFDTVCTEALWQAVMGKAPETPRGPMFPMSGVSWHDTQDFIAEVNAAVGHLELCLPSEAQWEYACRAGTQTRYSFSARITKKLVCFASDAPVAAGSLPPNPWGLREMHGNVWEWCEDVWHDDYRGAPADGSAWIGSDGGAASRVLRGGSWHYGARDVRSACRSRYDPGERDGSIGFRCARVQAR
jgi:formylglycine-generating enzyme required for sulfatase activity